MKDVRICIIGGGSRMWAIEFMRDLTMHDDITGTLVLYDRDYEAAKRNVSVAEQCFKVNHWEGHVKVVAEKEIGKALDGCNLVIISIEPGRTECRWGDLVLPEQYGILETVGDTTGPGGIMRARRSIPLFTGFAKEIKAHCPDAWVINYTNPMTLCTAALYREWPGIKALGCCHEVFHLENFIADKVAQWFDVPRPDRRDIEVDITGVNHFTWITKAAWNGKNLLPKLVELAHDPKTFPDETKVAMERIEGKKWFDCDHLVALALLRDFGALGAAGDRHLSEFIPWVLRDEKELWRYGVVRTPYEWRLSERDRKLHKVFSDEELKSKPTDEEGVDIMRSLMGDRTLYTNMNRPNVGQVSFLPQGRIVETMNYLRKDEIVPSVASNPPLAVRQMISHVSDVQQMTLDAICEQDDELLFRAFVNDPLVTIPLSQAHELFEKMLDACKLEY